MTALWLIMAVAISACLTLILYRAGARLGRLDVPNKRSLHTQPTPRNGGLAILTAIALSAIPIVAGDPDQSRWRAIALATVSLAAVSWYDDLFQVSPILRFLLHLIVSAGTVVYLMAPEALTQSIWLAPAMVILLAWFINLYNFMDGMDGLASGMTIIGFSACGWLAWLAGDTRLAAVYAVCAASVFGFLIFNFPPARIFMGDVGSSSLGYLAGAIGLLAVENSVFQPQTIALVFSPFLFDASITLIRRAIASEPVWQPHRKHLYQRLVRAGWSQRRTLGYAYAVMISAALTAVIAEHASFSWIPVLAVWLGIYLAILVGVGRVEQSAHLRGQVS